MHISNDEIQILEQGLRDLHSTQTHKRSYRSGNTRMKSFNELYSHEQAKQPTASEIYAQNAAKQREYEEEQKRREQEWLKHRSQSYATKGGYETKLITRPYVQFYATGE
jgi:hypothetical protein